MIITQLLNQSRPVSTGVIIFVLTACSGAAPKDASDAISAGAETDSPTVTSQALMTAVQQNNLTELKRLAGSGHSLSFPDENGLYPLSLAAYLGHAAIVDFLVSKNVDVNATMADGTSALILAAQGGHSKILSRLLEAGANVNQQTQDGVSALMLATIKDDATQVRQLLAQGADPNLEDRFGDTAVVGAAAAGKLESLKALTTVLDRLELSGKALTEACLAGQTSAFVLLADHGVDVESEGREGWTCLMLAAWNGHLNLINAAMSRGVDVNAADATGWSVLMTAAAVGDPDIVKLLLDRGADPSRQDAAGRTAITVAEASGDRAVAELLWAATGTPSKSLTSDVADRDLSTRLECPIEFKEGDLAHFMAPVIWHPADAAKRWGRGNKRFSEVRSSKAVPVEVCQARGEARYLMRLTCDDGTSPFTDIEGAAAARAGSVGAGGRCGKIVDLYIIHCSEASYKLYMDMYHCTPFDP